MNDNAIIPTRASKESAGLDLYSIIDLFYYSTIILYLFHKILTGL